jgi:SAM-dependent methyltransferase
METGQEASVGEVREQQRKHWNAVAEGWGAWLQWTERNFRPLTVWLRDAAGWTPGARVLDVACGAGYPALEAARAVGPQGGVVAADLSGEMVAVAARQARAAGLANVEFAERDAEDLRLPPASFDGASNVCGLMFSADPVRAAREAHRVLAPGGRFAAVAWDELAKSPFFGVMLGVAAPALGLAPPAPDTPGPFRLAAADALRSVLEAAGFAGVRVESAPMTFEFASAAEYVRIFSDYAFGSRIAALSPDEAARFRGAVAEAARPFTRDGRLRLTATALRASGRKD